MATDTHTIEVSESLYRRLERLAALKDQPVEAVIAQALTSSMPPLPDDLPQGWRSALMRLETLSDAQLWEQTQAILPTSEYLKLTELRAQRREGAITPEETRALDDLTDSTDLLTLKKAYAAVLLKWRGHPLPSLDEASA